MILSFELTMPNVGSWNGKWTGANKRYIKFRKLAKDEAMALMDGSEQKSFYYDFGDGWGASIKVTPIDFKQKRNLERMSGGFYGYEWMIDSILKNGKIQTK